jgi:hypothetical protein
MSLPDYLAAVARVAAAYDVFLDFSIPTRRSDPSSHDESDSPGC